MTVNALSPATDISDRIVHGVIFDVALRAAETYIFAQLPWLNFPGLKQLAQFLLNKVAEVLYDQLATFVAFRVIEIQAGHEKDAYNEAIANLRLAVHPLKGPPDVEAIRLAKEEVRNRLRTLIALPH